MARITPKSSDFSISGLEDHEAYTATLKDIDWATSDEKYGGECRLVLDWDLEGQEYSVRDWVGLRLGKQQSGQVSKLRALLNAIAGKPEATEVAWFDDDSTEWSYDGATPYGKLQPGVCEVIIRGTNVPKEDGTSRFSVKVYQAIKAQKATAPKIPVLAGGRSEAQVAADEVDDDQIPF